MARATGALEVELAAAMNFAAAAYADGIISLEVKKALEEYAERTYRAAIAPSPTIATGSVSQPHYRTPETPAPHVDVSSVEVTPAPTAVPDRPADIPPARIVEPELSRPSRPPREPAPMPPPEQVPVEPAGPTLAERAHEWIRGFWSKLSADFAANALIYLGVLLSVVVIFVFFAFGYFGEAVKTPSMRSPIFLAAPLIFFGLAWVLRNKTGVPAAADAVGLIGALILPIMLAALLQDGSDWGNRSGAAAWFPLSWIPNLDGPDRWPGYAVVGVICAFVYFGLSLRHRIYAYGVAPMLWAVVGALGLFWSSGMSGPQMLLVLAAIGIGLVAATVWRNTYVGRAISYQTVRVGVIGAPVVFAFALLFAYNDAVEMGTTPTLADLAHPGAAAAGMLAGVLAVSSGTGFAWQGLGERTRSSLAVGLRVAAYLAAGIAVVLALSYEITPGWLGAVLVAYGFGVAVVDRLVGGTGEAVTWLARGSVVLGATLTLTDPAAVTVAWSVITVVVGLRATLPAAQRLTSGLMPYAEQDRSRDVELWFPAFVLAGAGVARLFDVEAIPWVLLAAAGVSVAMRTVPTVAYRLRSFATIPTIVFAVCAVVAGVAIQSDRDPYSLAEIGVGLAALTVISAAVAYPWTWRLPFVLLASIGAVVVLSADLLELDDAGVSMVLTIALSITGIALIAATYAPALRRWVLPHGLYGHLALYLALLVSLVSEDAALVALAVAVAVHGAEAFLVERDRVPVLEQMVERFPDDAWLQWVPPVVALVLSMPLTLIAARQFAWFATDPARLAIPLSALAIGYGLVARAFAQPVPRRLGMLLAYAATAGAITIALPELLMLVVALCAGAMATFLVAVAAKRAIASAPSWALAFAACVAVASQAGMADEHLYRPLLAAAISVVLLSVAAMLSRHRVGMAAWFATAGAVASVAVAAGVIGAVSDDSWLWAWAAGAAVSIAAYAAVHRAALLTSLLWAYALVAYVDVFESEISSDAVWMMPFAGALVAISAILPGHRSWNLARYPSPVATVAALLTMGAAVSVAAVEGEPGATMAWSALALATLTVIRAEDAWFHIAGLVLIAAGASTGGPWPMTSLAIVAAAETVMAELRRETVQGFLLPWVAAWLWGATFAAAADWFALVPGSVVSIALVGGAVLSAAVVAAWVLSIGGTRLQRWMGPVGLLGQVAIIAAGAIASAAFTIDHATLVWSAAAVIESALIGVPGTLRRSTNAVAVSTALAGISAGLLMRGLPLSDAAVVFTLFTFGVALSAICLGRWMLRRDASRVDLWLVPVAVLGQIAFVGSAVQAWWSFAEPDMELTWAAIVWAEAVLVGIPATVKRHAPAVWLSTALIGAAAALTLMGLRLDWIEAVWTSAILAVVLLTVWLVSVVGTENDRVLLWQLPVAALGQAAIASSGFTASAGLSTSDAMLTWMVLLAIDGVAIAVVATVTVTGWMAALSTAMSVAVLALAIAWREPGIAEIWVWFGSMLAAGVLATVVTRIRGRSPRAEMWLRSMQALTLVLLVVAAWRGVDLLAPNDASLFGAALTAFIGVHVLANRSWLETANLEPLSLAAVSFVLSSGLVAASLEATSGWSLPTLLAVALGGAASAGFAGATTARLRVAWIVGAVGLTVVAAGATAILYEPVSTEFAMVLLVNGAGLAAAAVTAREPRLLHGAVLAWLVATLLLIESRWTLELHATVIAVSVVLLIAIEVERLRRRKEGLESPDWLRIAEWFVMLAPLVLAARDMVVASLLYGLLLAGEGFVFLIWGTLSQVRRRAVIGLAAVTAAILMAVAIPLIQGVGDRLTGGWWLVIGGVAAVAFITIGSLIEKYRTRLGQRLTEMGEILERWE